jgi:hypothetical protein
MQVRLVRQAGVQVSAEVAVLRAGRRCRQEHKQFMSTIPRTSNSTEAEADQGTVIDCDNGHGERAYSGTAGDYPLQTCAGCGHG